MPEVEIIREEIFVVDRCEVNSYGDLLVTDQQGNEHKVNNKHQSIHKMFENGKAVKVGYGKYMNREFIHTAVQVADEIDRQAPKKAQPIATVTRPETSKPKAEPVDIREDERRKIRSMSISYAKDMCVAGTIDRGEIAAWARFYEGYMLGHIKPKDTDVFRKILASLDCEIVK